MPDPEDQTEERGEAREYEGVLEIDLLAGGKGFQGTWLRTESEGRLLLGYRPRPEHAALVDRRVVVRGYPYRPPPHAQHIAADHLVAESVVPAADEPAFEPWPPLVEDGPGLRDRMGEWAQVVGTFYPADEVEGPEPAAGGREAARHRLVLADGVELDVETPIDEQASPGEIPPELHHRQATLVGRVEAAGADPAARPALDPVIGHLPGRSPRRLPSSALPDTPPGEAP